MRIVARLWATLAGLAVLGAVSPAGALSTSDARARAEKSISSAEADTGKIRTAMDRARRPALTPEERLARGDILLHAKDNERAIEIFSQVKELFRQGKAKEAANADATFLLGEAYFRSEQFLSARREFRETLDHATQAPYDRYAGRALARLVDCALRTGRYEDLDDVFARLDKLPTADANGSLQYARAKAYFARKDYANAKSAAQSVPASSEWSHQAQYLLGVVLLKEATPVAQEAQKAAEAAAVAAATAPPGTDKKDANAPNADMEAMRTRYSSAVDQFQKVAKLPAKTKEQRHVVDLAWMAMGRLFYEGDNFVDAAEAYSHVERASPEFGRMLFELAWVYVRLGDYHRAERALEVLSITDPDTLELADGALLRADLLLRSGEFDEAQQLYQSVRDRFDPVRQQLDDFISGHSDPAAYYDKLVEEQIEGAPDALPPMVVRWAREEAEDDRVFGLIDDVQRSRDLVRKSRVLARKLNAVLAAPTRARAFPELKAGLEAAIGLINRVGTARRTLALGMDDVAGDGSGELATVRAERRKLMDRLGKVPVAESDFTRREAVGEKQWNLVSQKIQRLQLEADRLQAIINALRRVMRDGDKYGVSRDATSRQRFQAEIEANEKDLETYRKRIKQFQEAVDMGRVQIGFGDQRYVDDDAVRKRFTQLFTREVELCASGQDGGSAQEYARSIQPVLSRAQQVEAKLEASRGELEKDARERADKFLEEVNREAGNIETFAQKLDDLDQEARIVVGEVAMRNFALVRERLKSVVLRADVGIVQQAWEVRETQRLRVRNLQRERALEEQKLNDELREVLDDAEGQ